MGGEILVGGYREVFGSWRKEEEVLELKEGYFFSFGGQELGKEYLLVRLGQLIELCLLTPPVFLLSYVFSNRLCFSSDHWLIVWVWMWCYITLLSYLFIWIWFTPILIFVLNSPDALLVWEPLDSNVKGDLTWNFAHSVYPIQGTLSCFFFPFISDISIYIPVLAPISGFSLDYWFDVLTCAWGEKHFLWYFGGQELWKSISKVIFSVFRDDLEKLLYLPFWSFTCYPGFISFVSLFSSMANLTH